MEHQEAEKTESVEFWARLFLVAGLVALFYCVWMGRLPGAVNWQSRALRVLPRVSCFTLGLFAIFIVQGSRLSGGLNLFYGALALIFALCLQSGSGLFELVRSIPANAINQEAPASYFDAGSGLIIHAKNNMLSPGVVLLLMRFELHLFAGIFLGTWLGGGINKSWHLLAVLLMAAVGDVWMNVARWPEAGEVGNTLQILRLPFPAAVGGFNPAPHLTDIIFPAAILQAARKLRLHSVTLMTGMIAGYCGAAFLGAEPTPGIMFMSMLLVGFGVLTAALPDLELDYSGVGKAFLLSALLILTLSGMTALQRRLNPAQKQIENPGLLRNAA